MVPAQRTGSAAVDSWENYHVEGEHMCTADLFLIDFMKNRNFL
jgi:hypothetical protein